MGIGATVALIKALSPKTDPAEIEQIEQDVSDLKKNIEKLIDDAFSKLKEGIK